MLRNEHKPVSSNIDLTLDDNEPPTLRGPRPLARTEHSIIDLTKSPPCKPKPLSSSSSSFLDIPADFSRYQSYELNYPTRTPDRDELDLVVNEPDAQAYTTSASHEHNQPLPSPAHYDSYSNISAPPAKRQRMSTPEASSSQRNPQLSQIHSPQPSPPSSSQSHAYSPLRSSSELTHALGNYSGDGTVLKSFATTASTQPTPSRYEHHPIPPPSSCLQEPSVFHVMPATQPAPHTHAHKPVYPHRLPMSQPLPQMHARTPASLDMPNLATPVRSNKRRLGAADEPPQEKRAARFKKACPKVIQERVERVKSQRFFMIERRRMRNELKEEFDVLGSTGNVYTVSIDKMPCCSCPDSQKGNHCKHILFIFFKVLQVKEDSGFWYQKALLSDELRQIFAEAPLAPGADAHPAVKEALANATGRTVPGAAADTVDKRKIPGPEDDCPVCYESMHALDLKKLVFCDSCHNALHTGCFNQWAKSKAGSKLTCVWCRASWRGIMAGSQGGGLTMSEGYVNLADVAGLSRHRDTSSYHHTPGRSRPSYSYRGDMDDEGDY